MICFVINVLDTHYLSHAQAAFKHLQAKEVFQE